MVLAAVGEDPVRQAVAAVVEGEFAGPLDDVLERDPGGGEQHGLVDDHIGGVLMPPVAVALLEQKLLEGERLCLEDQRQEAGDARMEADLPRALQVYIQIEDAVVAVRPGAHQPLLAAMLEIGADEVAGLLVKRVHVGDQRVDGRLVDRLVPDEPTVIDEMREVACLRAGHRARRIETPQAVHRIRGVGPEGGNTEVGIESGRHLVLRHVGPAASYAATGSLPDPTYRTWAATPFAQPIMSFGEGSAARLA